VLPHALKKVVPGQKYVLDLAALRAEQQRLGFAGGTARGLEYERRAAAGRMRVAAMKISDRRELLDRLHHFRLPIHGQLGKVIQASDIGGLDSAPAPVPPVKRNLPGESHDLEKALVLDASQFIPAHSGEAPRELAAKRILAAYRRQV